VKQAGIRRSSQGGYDQFVKAGKRFLDVTEFEMFAAAMPLALSGQDSCVRILVA